MLTLVQVTEALLLPTPIQPNPWRPFLSLLFPSASSREIASNIAAGKCARKATGSLTVAV